MRYELSDYEWTAIKPMLPNKPRGVRRVNDRRVLNGIFWVLRYGAPWRALPATYGPRTACYNRFVHWRQAGVWDQIMDSLAAGHDAAVQMIDISIVRMHQHGACIAGTNHQDMGRSRGRLVSKIHAVVDTNGLPVRLALTPGEARDNRLCSILLSAFLPQTMLLADRSYDADWIRELARQQGAWANIPPKRNRKELICFSPYLYRARNQIERFFNKIKQCWRVATRYDKLAEATFIPTHEHDGTSYRQRLLLLCALLIGQPTFLLQRHKAQQQSMAACPQKRRRSSSVLRCSMCVSPCRRHHRRQLSAPAASGSPQQPRHKTALLRDQPASP